MRFADRRSAAVSLAARLERYKGASPLVLGIPRGAVPMARVIAEALDGDLDVVLVRKIGAPDNPEFAIGSVSETGDVALNPMTADLGIGQEYVAAQAGVQLATLRERRRRLAPLRQPADPAGRVVIVVDDGVATGATMLAALTLLRRARPKRLVAAMAVAPPDTLQRISDAADEVVCLLTPDDFRAVGQYFGDFSPVTDDEVVAEMREFHRGRRGAGPTGRSVQATEGERVLRVEIPAGGVRLEGELVLPSGASGLVLFAHGSGSSRLSPRNVRVAAHLRSRNLGTILFDLLTEEEDAVRDARFDIELLTQRLEAAVAWTGTRTDTGHLALGCFGASTGAACALRAASEPASRIAAVVSRGGRPDLALPELGRVRAPTLLIVGGRDESVLRLNEIALARLRCEKRLEVVPGATHLFEEPGALETVAELAADWFERHLCARRSPAATAPG